MNNLEVGRPDSERNVQPRQAGERLPIDPVTVMAEQFTLARLMTPKEVGPHVDESKTDDERSAVSRLFEKWIAKYSSLFREYCDNLDPEKEEEQKLAERLISGRLTSDDYEQIKAYLEDPVREDKELGFGGPLFKDTAEIQEFLKPYVH